MAEEDPEHSEHEPIALTDSSEWNQERVSSVLVMIFCVQALL